jgi:hypothetical protein
MVALAESLGGLAPPGSVRGPAQRVFTSGSEPSHRGFGLIGERDNPRGARRAADSVNQCAAEVASSVGAVVSLDEHQPLVFIEGDLQLPPIRSVVPPDHRR